MNKKFAFTVKSIRFDEDYNPSESTRITTNFANLARGEKRQENLRNALVMIDNRFNSLAHWDNPKGDRYCVELEIISVELKIDAEDNSDTFPVIEILKTNIVDKKRMNALTVLSGIIFPPTYVIMILACCFLRTIREKTSLPFPIISANYTETSSSTSSIQTVTKAISPKRR